MKKQGVQNVGKVIILKLEERRDVLDGSSGTGSRCFACTQS